jgi:hypothetical protein
MAKQASCWQYPWEILSAVLTIGIGTLMEMCHLLVNPKYKELWGKPYTTKLGCLAQGIPGVSNGTNMVVFIRLDNVLIERCKDVTYKRMCINYCLEKADPNCACITVGGNHITCPGNCSTPTMDMVTVKIHLNSAVSTKGACYCKFSLKDFYLNTPMARPEIMHMN